MKTGRTPALAVYRTLAKAFAKEWTAEPTVRHRSTRSGAGSRRCGFANTGYGCEDGNRENIRAHQSGCPVTKVAENQKEGHSPTVSHNKVGDTHESNED